MNVTPVQNNNSQSFGMAFKLKNNGARNLAAALEATTSEYASKFEKDVLGKIHASKTDVIYDGENVIIKANSKDVYGNSWHPEKITDLIVSDQIPVLVPSTNQKILQYTAKDNYAAPHVFKVCYDNPQNILDVSKHNSLMQKLFNAKEIIKRLEADAANRAYKTEQAAARQARINAKADELSKLYG